MDGEIERERALARLGEFPPILRRVVEITPESLQRRRGEGEWFAVVEHVWHLADLEEEGFAVRIIRLVNEPSPQFPDFRGDEIAAARRYLEQPIEPALARFESVRLDNRFRLGYVTGDMWSRRGTHEVSGELTLGDLPRMMLEHDREHARQLLALLRELGVEPPDALVRFAEET